MKKYYLLIASILISLLANAQHAVLDSLKSQLAKATTHEAKIEIMGHLSKVLMNTNLSEAEKYGKEMISLAEMTRNRKLMVQALLINGERYSYLAGRKDNLEKAMDYYEQALELARKNKLDEEMVRAYLLLSEVSRYIPDNAKALNYSNQAFSNVNLIKNDSLLAKVHLEFGSVYLAQNEKILALKNYMTAIRIAEDLKNNTLLRAGYSRLSTFYFMLEDFDKAIDYQIKATNRLSEIKTGQTPYFKIQDLSRTGDIYAAKKNNDIAMNYYEQSLKLADSLKYEPIKAIAYRSIINNYLNNGQPQQALQYFNSHPQLKQFMEAVNFSYFIDHSYGYIYSQLGNYDSAKYYYNKVAPFFERDVNNSNKLNYYFQLGQLHKKTQEYDTALAYFLKANALAKNIGELNTMSNIALQLDSLYQQKGDFKEAFTYSNLHHLYKDSINKLGKEKDLLQIEVADEQQRLERQEKERLELKRKRDNIQYLLITIGIASLFILLVMMGMFKVSAATIKMIGFFTFLMFFEFIFLIFKKNIYGFTKGEPWKDLAFMIMLAAILLPLHHWLEHKVIHYLTSHNRLTLSGKGLINKVFKKNISTKI